MFEPPQRVARVFALRELEGLKGEEICNVMRISSTNLGVILYLVRMRLKKCLEINWFEQTLEME